MGGILTALGMDAGTAAAIGKGLETAGTIYGISQALRPDRSPFDQAAGLLTALNMIVPKAPAGASGLPFAQYDVPAREVLSSGIAPPDWLRQINKWYNKYYSSPLRYFL